MKRLQKLRVLLSLHLEPQAVVHACVTVEPAGRIEGATAWSEDSARSTCSISHYIARLSTTTAPASCHGGYQGVGASSSNVRPLRAQKNSGMHLATCGKPAQRTSTTNNFLEELKRSSHKIFTNHLPSKVSWTQHLVGILARQILEMRWCMICPLKNRPSSQAHKIFFLLSQPLLVLASLGRMSGPAPFGVAHPCR